MTNSPTPIQVYAPVFIQGAQVVSRDIIIAKYVIVLTKSRVRIADTNIANQFSFCSTYTIRFRNIA